MSRAASDPNHSIELVRPVAPRPKISHAIFDFDGTLSWLRHGWPQIMRDLFREHLAPGPGESETRFGELMINEILSLNGKPTIHQMIRLGELATERGVPVPDPEALRAEYQKRLDDKIAARSMLIRGNNVKRDHYAVHGVRPLLDSLHRRGVKMYVLSGTVETRVREEAELLDLARYFDGRIHGSPADGLTPFSKKQVIDRVISEEKISGEQLLSFGDGPVEIANTKEVGGLAVAVASNEEANGSGLMDPWKRHQLLEAGADFAIADYRDAEALLNFIFGK